MLLMMLFSWFNADAMRFDDDADADADDAVEAMLLLLLRRFDAAAVDADLMLLLMMQFDADAVLLMQFDAAADAMLMRPFLIFKQKYRDRSCWRGVLFVKHSTRGVQDRQQYIHIETDIQHSKWECSNLNEVFKIGNSTYTSTGIGRGSITKFQTYIQ
jgi:hypothetical protein